MVASGSITNDADTNPSTAASVCSKNAGAPSNWSLRTMADPPGAEEGAANEFNRTPPPRPPNLIDVLRYLYVGSFPMYCAESLGIVLPS